MGKAKVVDEETVRVAENFKRLRKEKGWTLFEAGQQGGVSYKYVGHIERLNTGLGKRARAKWAIIFGVDVSEFLKPIDSTDHQNEITELKKEVEQYSLEKIKRLRQILPILLGEGDSDHEIAKRKRKKNPGS